MAFYECVFILRQDIAAQDIHKVLDFFTQVLTKVDAIILKKELWGLRSLAYPVKKNKKGYYIMLIVDASPAALIELERNFKISEDVLRYLITKVDSVPEAPSYMMSTPSECEMSASNS